MPIVAHEGLFGSTPVVELNRRSGLDHPAVVSNDRAGVRALTQHVVEAGYTHVVAVVGGEQFSTSRERVLGFRDALPEARVLVTDFSPSGGERALWELAGNPPQAIIPLSSRLTLGVLRAARALGFSIPHDMAVAGYGNPEWFEVWGPGITTFAPPLPAMGATAARMLLDLIQGESLDQPVVSLDGEVLLRGTVPGR